MNLQEFLETLTHQIEAHPSGGGYLWYHHGFVNFCDQKNLSESNLDTDRWHELADIYSNFIMVENQLSNFRWRLSIDKLGERTRKEISKKIDPYNATNKIFKIAEEARKGKLS